MAESNDKNTLIYKSFIAFLNDWYKSTGRNQAQVAAHLGFPQGTFNNWLKAKSGMSLSKMEVIADKIGINLFSILAEGRLILDGESPTNPPVTAEAPPAPASISTAEPRPMRETYEDKDAIIAALKETIAAQKEAIEGYKKTVEGLEREQRRASEAGEEAARADRLVSVPGADITKS